MPKWGLAMKSGLVVDWLKHPGDAVQQGEPIVEIKRQKAEMLTRQQTTTRAATTGTRTGVRAPVSPGGRVNASPAARRLAQELGVDLAVVAGTGPGGMIGREDVLRAAEEAKAAPSEEAEERDVDVGGITVHCLVAGPVNAPHVVFVHGLG